MTRAEYEAALLELEGLIAEAEEGGLDDSKYVRFEELRDAIGVYEEEHFRSMGD